MVAHGGMTKVGKVRGQTPKVKKTEKKRPARGRAHKRKIYNRRAINVRPGESFSPNTQTLG